jgi:integrase
VPNIAFSDVGLRSIKPPLLGQLDYWDNKLPGFGLRVSQGGSKTFILKRRNARITLGRLGVLTLAEARAEAKRLLAEFTLGKLRPRAITYPEAVKQFIENKTRSRRASTAAGYEWLLNHFPFKGQLTEITADDVTRALKIIKSRSTYDHALVASRIFFNWAMKRRYVEHNPTFGLSPHGTQRRARVLTDDEIKSLWNATDEPTHFNRIVRLLLLTGQRRGEIAALRKQWICDYVVTLPAELTKNRRAHSFPIASLSNSVISSAATENEGLIFPSLSKKASTPFNGWSKSKSALDKKCLISGWTLHDLRRTFASNLAALGVRLEVIEKLLNHQSGSFAGVVGIYQRHSYMEEMRAAVELWETQLKMILGQPA